MAALAGIDHLYSAETARINTEVSKPIQSKGGAFIKKIILGPIRSGQQMSMRASPAAQGATKL